MYKNKLYDNNSCYPSKFEIENIVRNYLGNNTINFTVEELYVGMKNVLYLIKADYEPIVLKIAPTYNETMLTFENNNISWEAEMLKLMEYLNIPSPKLLLYDDSGTINKTPYFFMTYIEGEQFQNLKKNMHPEIVSKIEEEIGKICSQICSIKGNKFFLPCLPDVEFDNNYDFIYTLFNILVNNANEKNIKINGIDYNKLLQLISSFKHDLNQVNEISLTNVDAWEGNFMIKDNNISGIVDFSDLYYCDELMTFYFHSIHPEISSSFLKGYGKPTLTESELTRTIIYRVWTLMKMIVEKEYKVSNEHLDDYEWLYKKFYREIDRLEKRKELVKK